MNRLAVAVTLALAGSASAQELNFAATSAARPNLLQARTGLDHAFVAQVGYLRALPGDVFVGGEVAMPWANPDLQDYRVRATAGLPLLAGENWKLAGWLSPTLRATQNDASNMLALGADLRLVGGYYARGWFLAGELGVDWLATTHVSFSQAYRKRVYAGAQDGWYGLPGGTTYAGLHGGLSFSSFDLVLRVGQPRTTSLALQTVPFYATLGVNLAL